MSSTLKVDILQDSGGNTILSSDGSGNVTQTKTGIIEADQYRLTADLSAAANPISSNLERVDDTGFAKIGTGVSVSSGTWSFGKTGLYLVRFIGMADTNGLDNLFIDVKTTTNNSTYTVVGTACCEGNGSVGQGAVEIFFNVTNTTTHKMQFELSSVSSGSALRGDTSKNETSWTFLRIGDSQ